MTDAEPLRSANVVWQPGEITRDQRWAALGGPGATVWFTGLPSSGKSTVAAAVEARLLASGRPAVHRGLGLHAAGGVRAPRPQGAVRPRPRRRDPGLHRHRPAVRGAVVAR